MYFGNVVFLKDIIEELVDQVIWILLFRQFFTHFDPPVVFYPLQKTGFHFFPRRMQGHQGNPSRPRI